MGDPGSKTSWAVGKKAVLCVGICVIDSVSVVKRYPKEGEEKRCVKGYWQRGGNVSNMCTVLRILGVSCEFLGMLSKSSLFSILIEDMEARNIKIDNCPRCELDPPFSSVIFSKSGKTRNIINCRSPAYPYITLEDFQKLDLNNYGWIHFRCVHFDVTRSLMREVEKFNNNVKGEKIIISIDFDKFLTEMWPLVDYCDYVFFSKQLALEHNWSTPKDACITIDERMRMRWGLNLKRPYIIFLWGDLGVGWMDRMGNYSLSPSYKPSKMVDSLGAGDTLVASFIYAKYIRDRDITVSLDFGNRMASYKCTKSGYDHISDILIPPVM